MKKTILFLILATFLSNCSVENMMTPLEFENISLLQISDGTFEGEYTDPKSEGHAKVKVTVSQHKIETLEILENNCSMVGKKGEYIVNSIMEMQSLDVDAISGATITSTVIKKAVEDALRKGYSNEQVS